MHTYVGILYCCLGLEGITVCRNPALLYVHILNHCLGLEGIDVYFNALVLSFWEGHSFFPSLRH